MDLLDGTIALLSKCDRVKLIFDRLIEPLDRSIGLRSAHPDATMLNLVKLKVKLIRM